MEKVFGFAILSLFITAILIVPFIDFLYKMKLQRQKQKTRDIFNNRTYIFDKLHEWKVGTPIGGGILIIFVVTILTLWAYGLFKIDVKFWEIFVLLFTFIGFGVLGFYDDLKKILNVKRDGFFGLRFKHKFIIQWILGLIAGVVLYLNGYTFVHIPAVGEIMLGVFYIVFAAFFIVSFANAYNIADGLDGLSSGVLLICLCAFLVISRALLNDFLAIFIAILLGSVGAFLYFNIYKARLWLGDVGSLSLGAALATIGLLTGKEVAVAIIGGVYVIEVGSSLIQILSKKFLKKKAFPIAPLHLYFLKRGWEEPKIVMRGWLLGFAFALIGLYLAFLR
jgi:phospho-N-acetylmuramoyl-pentapeptide-transferase